MHEAGGVGVSAVSIRSACLVLRAPRVCPPTTTVPQDRGPRSGGSTLCWACLVPNVTPWGPSSHVEMGQLLGAKPDFSAPPPAPLWVRERPGDRGGL